MKIVKTVLFIIWGFITFGFFILALIQRQDALKSHDYAIERQKAMLNTSVKMLEEYHRNIELLKKNTVNKMTIDSIYQSSEFLKTNQEIKK